MLENIQKFCVMLTRRCNLKCRGCNVINYPMKELTTEQWKSAFDIMKKRVNFIVLFGGEPTLRNDLPELVTYLNKIKLKHTIITNSVRLINDQMYYKKLIKAKPFGISCSLNDIYDVSHFDDELKSRYGYRLLQKLKGDLPKCDIVANMAITKQNINHLPDIIRNLSSQNIWSILTGIHLANTNDYWYRGLKTKDNKNILFTSEDLDNIQEIANYFYDNYDSLMLHNTKEYFKLWNPLLIMNDWKCHTISCPNINPDGSMMVCVDQPFTKNFSIFNFFEKEKEVTEDYQKVREKCGGCFWDHMWETNYWADKNIKFGKVKFTHEVKE